MVANTQLARFLPLESFDSVDSRYAGVDYVRGTLKLRLLISIANVNDSGTIPREPPIRLLAMPPASMLFAVGIQMLIIDILRYMKVPAPFRISSLPRGTPLRPGIYSIIEDVIAVDGSGGTEFRQRLNLRYMASHVFRQMLHRLTLFWAVGALLAASATTAIIFTCSRNVAYVVCFGYKARWVTPLTLQTDRLDTSIRLGSSMDMDNHHLRPEAIEARREDLERGAGESLSIILDLVCNWIYGRRIVHHSGVAGMFDTNVTNVHLQRGGLDVYTTITDRRW